MKVLHLATSDSIGGAARAAYRQHQALQSVGVESRMLVRHKHTNDPQVHAFAGRRNLSSRLERTLRRVWINRREQKSRAKNRYGLVDPRADLLRSMVPEMADADVINLHKTEHFVDVPALLAALPDNKSVVVTLHDLSPLTGGCDYPGNCAKFIQSCGCCPVLGSGTDKDFSREIFRLRQAAYHSRRPEKFAFVANSRWTLDNIKRSGLTANRRAELIHLAFDNNAYKPINQAVAREALGIRPDAAVICFAAHDLSLPHKGGAQLLVALTGLKLDRPVHLLTMGSSHFSPPPNFRHTHFGRLDSDTLQAVIYSAADVFVIPSMEEAFGQTALEAAACGAVIAGFAVGGILDIVQDGLRSEEHTSELQSHV